MAIAGLDGRLFVWTGRGPAQSGAATDCRDCREQRAFFQRLPMDARFRAVCQLSTGGLRRFSAWRRCRMRGVAAGRERVLAAIETVASVNGAAYLYLQTGADNASARALYERFGFAVIGHYHTRSAPLT